MFTHGAETCSLFTARLQPDENPEDHKDFGAYISHVRRKTQHCCSPSLIRTFTVGPGLGGRTATFTGSAACAVRGLGRHGACPTAGRESHPAPKVLTIDYLC